MRFSNTILEISKQLIENSLFTSDLLNFSILNALIEHIESLTSLIIKFNPEIIKEETDIFKKITYFQLLGRYHRGEEYRILNVNHTNPSTAIYIKSDLKYIDQYFIGLNLEIDQLTTLWTRDFDEDCEIYGEGNIINRLRPFDLIAPENYSRLWRNILGDRFEVEFNTFIGIVEANLRPKSKTTISEKSIYKLLKSIYIYIYIQ